MKSIKFIFIYLFVCISFKGIGQNVTDQNGKTYKILNISGKDTVKIWMPPSVTKLRSSDAETSSNDDYSHIPLTYTVNTSKDVGNIPIIQGTGSFGALTYTVPIETYPGRNGFQPEVSLYYNSQGGNGVAGTGWDISGISTIVPINDSPYFDGSTNNSNWDISGAFSLDGNRLIKVNTSGNLVNYETQQGNIKVEAYIVGNTISYFKAYYPAGQITTYGWTGNTSIKNAYPVTRMENTTRNCIDFNYVEDNNTYYVSEISYGGQLNTSLELLSPHYAKIMFNYDTRQDIIPYYSNGTEIKQEKLLKKITTYFENNVLRAYELNSTFDKVNYLKEITCYSDGKYLNPLKFYYEREKDVTPVFSGYNTGIPSGFNPETLKADGRELVTTRGNFKDSKGLVVYPDFPNYGVTKIKVNYWKQKATAVGAGSRFPSDQAICLYTDIEAFSIIGLIILNSGEGFMQMDAFDLDGDGLDEILKINRTIEGGKERITYRMFNIIQTLGMHVVSSDRSFDVEYDASLASGNLVPRSHLVGDFMGIGRNSIFSFSSNKVLAGSPPASRLVIIDPVGQNKISDTECFSYSYEDALFTLDYDGDGKTDIGHIFKNAQGNHILRVYTMDTNNTLTITGEFNFYDLENREMLLGDINGDGKTDILVSPEKNSSSSTWQIYYFKGKPLSGLLSDVVETKSMNITPYADDMKIFLQDMDNDGQSDFVINDNGTIKMRLTENGILKSQWEPYTTTVEEDYNFVEGNIVQNNRIYQLVTIDKYAKRLNPLYFTKDEAKERLLTGMINSSGIITTHSYANPMKDSGANYSCNIYKSEFPYNAVRDNININMLWNSNSYIGKRSVWPDITSPVSSVTYNYSDAFTHRQGLGFLGFSEITTYDYLSGAYTYEKYDPYNFSALKKMDTRDQTVNYTYSINESANKKLNINLINQTVQDKLKATLSLHTYTHDSYGNPLTEIINEGDGISSSIITNKYYNVNSNSYYLVGLPKERIETKTRNNSSVSLRANYRYNSNYQMTTINNYYNNNKVSEEAFGYDNDYNLVEIKSRLYSSTNWQVNTKTYDSYGRLQRNTGPSGLYIDYYYDNKGHLSYTENYKGHVTSYEYDKWGNVTKIINPNGTVKENTLTWVSSSSNALYKMKVTSSGQSEKEIYYDALGREVRKGEKRFNGDYIYSDMLYNSKNQLEKVSLPFKNTPLYWNIYNYDQYNRLTSLNYASGKVDSYIYDKLKVTAMTDSVSTTKTYDAAGFLIKVTNPSGSVTYSYRADGQLSNITAPGKLTTKFVYDQWGRQSGVLDPNSGNRSMEYDDAGNVNKEIDARGKASQYFYDTYNRMIQKVYDNELTTNFTYNDDGLLVSEISDNGNSKELQYDDLFRLSMDKETVIDNKFLQKNYTYNSLGQMTNVSYTSQSGSIANQNFIYTNGRMSEIKLNNSETIWKLTDENDMGQVIGIQTGALSRTYNYNSLGIPSERSVKKGSTFVQNYAYGFNGITGNLDYREDNMRSIREDFAYDKLDRLINYDDTKVSYNSKGNITKNSSLGRYNYGTSNLYAIETLSLYDNQIPTCTQEITYNAMHRPATISENGYFATFDYNGNGERKRMKLSHNDTLQLSRYYIAGVYELDLSIASTKEKLYLDGDAYTATAVYMRENGGNWSLYYVGRDYLGSITHVLNSSGDIIQELSYNAWGRLRNPDTQELYVIGSEPELFLGRGYTGHEHLREFGLINMNARLYDPVLGRFLSPDPYVQDPHMAQNYNRYSYALNNPLRYTDESGEIFINPMRWFSAAVTGFVKGVVKMIEGKGLERPFTDTWRSFANSIKIDWGLYKGSSLQILSRWTWELPQTFIGYNYSHYRNTVGNVDKVRYFDGATFVINEKSSKTDGISLGSYININIEDKYDYEAYGNDGNFKPWGNPLFMHEYGHYIQSQRSGWGYLISHGIPSIISAGNSEFYSRIYDPEINDYRILTTHRINWMEVDANKKAEKYFRERYGVDWSGNRYYSYPIRKP